jgi:hypothetical protein
MHLDLETEMLGVELDRSIHVVYDVAEARSHWSRPSFARLRPFPERIRITAIRQRLITGGCPIADMFKLRDHGTWDLSGRIRLTS